MLRLGELEGQIKLLMKRAEELQAQIDGMKGAEEKWPQAGDEYWFLHSNGDCERETWEHDPCDVERQRQGNTFRAVDEAIRKRDRRALIAELRRHPKACGFMADGSNWCLRWGIYTGWRWTEFDDMDVCPASGWFSEPDLPLIEQLGSRLDLLRSP